MEVDVKLDFILCESIGFDLVPYFNASSGRLQPAIMDFNGTFIVTDQCSTQQKRIFLPLKSFTNVDELFKIEGFYDKWIDFKRDCERKEFNSLGGISELEGKIKDPTLRLLLEVEE